jgi:hypothetical protein
VNRRDVAARSGTDDYDVVLVGHMDSLSLYPFF